MYQKRSFLKHTPAEPHTDLGLVVLHSDFDRLSQSAPSLRRSPEKARSRIHIPRAEKLLPTNTGLGGLANPAPAISDPAANRSKPLWPLHGPPHQAPLCG